MANRFQEKVLRYVEKIPAGKVMTYGEIAAALGRPLAARAVGQALKRNPQPFFRVRPGGIKAMRSRGIPCHRVVRSDRSIGGYAGGTDTKRQLLEREGVKFVNGRVGSDHLLSRGAAGKSRVPSTPPSRYL